MKRFFSFAALCGLLAFPAFAQTVSVPPLMNFQGRLARPDGTPLPDGAYPVTFSLWNVATGGSVMTNQLWSETDTVTARNGAFGVLLGAKTALTDSLFAGNLWLQIQVSSGAALLPRQPLVSVGYAFKSNLANTVPDGSITAAKLAASLTFPPTGAAGGDLTGSYPNPFLSNNTVNADKLAYDGESLTKVSAGVLSLINYQLGITGDHFLGLAPGVELFNYGGKTMGNYAIGWYGDSTYPIGAPVAWFSGWGGIKFFTQSTPRMFIALGGNVGINTTNPQSTLDVNGTITASAVQVTGADSAELYTIAAANGVAPAPGLVVCIDPEHPGQLKVSAGEHDCAVAGIISGAGGVRPGVVLRQPGTLADGDRPVASAGRVYCWCDADANGPIRSGDLLTTSNTPGHAMRVTDHARAQGAVIGKAMTALKSGKGMVLVLVTLQ